MPIPSRSRSCRGFDEDESVVTTMTIMSAVVCAVL